MTFIHLYYLCRDYGNHRLYNCVVFHNPQKRTLPGVEAIIHKHLLEGTWFIHSQWGLPDLLEGKRIPGKGPHYHEFVGLLMTEEIPIAATSDLEEFLERVRTSQY